MEIAYDEAVRDALAEEMRRDPLVWVMGEDLTTSHGSTSARQYMGLVEEFGPKRVVNTPISENTILGAGIGAAGGYIYHRKKVGDERDRRYRY